MSHVLRRFCADAGLACPDYDDTFGPREEHRGYQCHDWAFRVAGVAVVERFPSLWQMTYTLRHLPPIVNPASREYARKLMPAIMRGLSAGGERGWKVIDIMRAIEDRFYAEQEEAVGKGLALPVGTFDAMLAGVAAQSLRIVEAPLADALCADLVATLTGDAP